MTVRALIVDDEPLARERLRSLLAERGDVTVMGECADGASAVAAVRAMRPDLLFLDIQMPAMDGFEVVAALGDFLPVVVFVTAFDRYAVQAFDTSAIDYLLKPVNAERFARAVDRAVAAIEHPRPDATRVLHDAVEMVEKQRTGRTRFVVRRGTKLFFIRTGDVDWIDGASNYVRLHVAGKVHLVRDTLKAVEADLPAAEWLRIHRSVIIRLVRIASVEAASHGEYLVTMQDGARLTASRTYSSKLRALLR